MVVKATKKKLEELRKVKEAVARYRNFESEFQRFSQSATQDESILESQQKDDSRRLQTLMARTEELKKSYRMKRESNRQTRQSLEKDKNSLTSQV